MWNLAQHLNCDGVQSTGLPMKKAPCACAKAALTLDAPTVRLRTEAIRYLDSALLELSSSAGNDVSRALRTAAESADADAAAKEREEQEAAELAAKFEKEAAAVRDRAEKEALKAAAKAEKEAAKAAAEARRAVEEERAKQEAEARKAAAAAAKAEKEAAALLTREQRETKAREEAEARATAKAEREARAREEAEARAAAKAEKEVGKMEAAVAAAERKAAAEHAKAEAERAKAEAAVVAREQIEAEREAEKERQQRGSPSPRSSAASISQQRLERAQSRFSGIGGINPLGALRRNSAAGASDEPRGGDSGTSAFAVARSKAAERALEGAPVASRDADGAAPVAGPPLSTQVIQAAAIWLQAWRDARGVGVRAHEMGAVCGFTADCCALHRDGETLVSVGGDGDAKSVSIYSARSGRVRASMRGHTDKVCSVAIDGDVIASGSRDRTIRLWTLSGAGGECFATLEGCKDLIHGLALRGDVLLSGEGGGKKTGGIATARLWSVRAATCVATFGEHTASIFGVALGAELGVTASHDTTARVWQTAEPEGKSCGVLRHPAFVHSASIAQDLAATGCGDGKVRVWALSERFPCLQTLDHSGVGLPISSVRLEGAVLVSGGEDRNVKVWSIAGEGACVCTLPHGEAVKGLALSPSLGLVASTGGLSDRLVLWRAAPPPT